MKKTIFILCLIFSGLVQAGPFADLSTRYEKATMPREELFQKSWGLVAVVPNEDLKINKGYKPRIDYQNGVKNHDGSQLQLFFERFDRPYYPKLSLTRKNLMGAGRTELFIPVEENLEKSSIQFKFLADISGKDKSVILIENCRYENEGAELLICPITFTLSKNPLPVYQGEIYREALNQEMVIQVFKKLN